MFFFTSGCAVIIAPRWDRSLPSALTEIQRQRTIPQHLPDSHEAFPCFYHACNCKGKSCKEGRAQNDKEDDSEHVQQPEVERYAEQQRQNINNDSLGQSANSGRKCFAQN